MSYGNSDDLELRALVRDYCLEPPPVLMRAGRFLDGRFGVEPTRERVLREAAMSEANGDPEQVADDLRAEAAGLTLHACLRRAVAELSGDTPGSPRSGRPAHKRLAFAGNEVLGAILIITWLCFDREADKRPHHICHFQSLPWNLIDAATGLGRMWLSDVVDTPEWLAGARYALKALDPELRATDKGERGEAEQTGLHRSATATRREANDAEWPWFDDQGGLTVQASGPMSGLLESLSRHLRHFLARVEACERADDGTYLLRDSHAGSLVGGAQVVWERVILLAQGAVAQTLPGMTAEERETYDRKGVVAKASRAGRNALPLVDSLRQITLAILYGPDGRWVDRIPAASIAKLKALNHEVDLFRDQYLRSEGLVARSRAAAGPADSNVTPEGGIDRVWVGLASRFRSIAEATTAWEQQKRLYPVLREAGQALLDGVSSGVIPAPSTFAPWLRAEIDRDIEVKRTVPEHKRLQRSDAELLWLDPYCRGFEAFCAKHTQGRVDPPACGWGAFDSRGRNEDQVRAMLVERAQAYARCCEAIAGSISPESSSDGAGATRQEGDPAPGARTQRWTQEAVVKAAKHHLKRNDFPGVRALARIVGCPESTMSEAIKSDEELTRARDAYMNRRRPAARSVRAGCAGDAIESVGGESPAPELIEERAHGMLHRLVEESEPADREATRVVIDEHRDELGQLFIAAMSSDDPEAYRVASEAAQDLIRQGVHERSRVRTPRESP